MTQDEVVRLIVILEAADRIAKTEDQGTAYGEAAQALQAQQAEIERLKGINEHDRSIVADGVTGVMDAIAARSWLAQTRGSYKYDDDSWMGEFGQAIDEITEALAPLRRVARDLTDCPATTGAIAKACEAWNPPQ